MIISIIIHKNIKTRSIFREIIIVPTVVGCKAREFYFYNWIFILRSMKQFINQTKELDEHSITSSNKWVRYIYM